MHATERFEKVDIDKLVPFVFAEHLTEAQKCAYMIADNRLALNAGWDTEMLSVEPSDLQGVDFNLSVLGFDDAELNKLLGDIDSVQDDDFDVDAELKKPAITRLGDLWLLGKHRLVYGDSTEADTFTVLMDGKQANLVVTDPPYNVNYGGSAGKIKNDSMGSEAFYKFLLAAFKNIEAVMAKDASIYVFHADTEGLNVTLRPSRDGSATADSIFLLPRTLRRLCSCSPQSMKMASTASCLSSEYLRTLLTYECVVTLSITICGESRAFCRLPRETLCIMGL